MNRRLGLLAISAILVTAALVVVFNVNRVEASDTIYIRADGSIDPLTANIMTADNVMYYFTDSNYDSIVVQRNNITVDGDGFTLQGSESGTGISCRRNMTIRNIEIHRVPSSSHHTVVYACIGEAVYRVGMW